MVRASSGISGRCFHWSRADRIAPRAGRARPAGDCVLAVCVRAASFVFAACRRAETATGETEQIRHYCGHLFRARHRSLALVANDDDGRECDIHRQPGQYRRRPAE